MDSTYITFHKMTNRDFAVKNLDNFTLYFSSPNTMDLREIRLKSPKSDEKVKNFLKFLDNNGIHEICDYTLKG